MRECRIADAMNTYQYALTLIYQKGYKIFLVPDVREEYLGEYWAIKDQRDFIADDPLRLLGLIHIWENFGDEWYENPRFPLLNDDKILSRALPDTIADFEAMSEQDFQTLKEDYKVLFEALVLNFSIYKHTTPKEMFEIIMSYYLN